MPLLDKLREYVAAAFTGLWVQSHKLEDALREIVSLCSGRENGDWKAGQTGKRDRFVFCGPAEKREYG
jgi:hypothetical protein